MRLYKSALEEKIIEANMKTLQLIANDLEAETQKIEDIAKSLCLETVIFDFSDERFREYYKDKGGLQTIKLAIKKLFDDKMIMDNKITDIAILSNNGELVFSSGRDAVSSNGRSFSDVNVREKCIRLVNASTKPEVISIGDVSENLLLYIMPIYGKTEYKEVGKLLFLFMSDYVKNSILKCDPQMMDKSEELSYFIYDGRGLKVYLNNLNSKIEYKEILSQLNNDNGYTYTNLVNKKAIIFLKNVAHYNFKIYKIVSVNYMMDRVNYISRILIAVILVVIIIIIFLFYYTFSLFSRNMARLINTMKKISSGDLDKRFPIEYHDEIDIIGAYLNKMVEEIELLIKNVNEIEVKNKEAQISLLQSQINPHFLYNTLDSIRMMALVNNDKKVADVIHTLSNLFRTAQKKIMTWCLLKVRYSISETILKYRSSGIPTGLMFFSI